MAVHFVDSKSGEVSSTPGTVGAVNMAWFVAFVALIIGFFVGGGVSNLMTQEEVRDLQTTITQLRDTTIVVPE